MKEERCDAQFFGYTCCFPVNHQGPHQTASGSEWTDEMLEEEAQDERTE